jgi:hypothetical protein
MKKLILYLAAASILVACQSKKTDKYGNTIPVRDTVNAPVIKFEKDSYDFGKIKQGDKVNYEFKFINAGKSPLIITNAVASCGCTTPKWPNVPLAPGQSGKIKVTFNSEGKTGLQDKQITITANTIPAQSMVHLIGEVLTK